jgi:hypothetical protein
MHFPDVPTVTPSIDVKLKDVTVPHLPDPFYHFEYDNNGKLALTSFASGLFIYKVNYDNDRITEMINTVPGSSDTLRFLYDDFGRINLINYYNRTGGIYRKVYLTYEGALLVKLKRDVRFDENFVTSKTITLDYFTDGNLSEMNVNYPAVDGSEEQDLHYHFDNYDAKINVDAFDLLHTDFFDQLFFIPGIQLQKNNPGKETLNSANVNYEVNYTYTYTDKGTPLTKTGDFHYTTGDDAGKHIQTNSFYSYY